MENEKTYTKIKFSSNTGKFGPEKNSVFGHFSRSGVL